MAWCLGEVCGRNAWSPAQCLRQACVSIDCILCIYTKQIFRTHFWFLVYQYRYIYNTCSSIHSQIKWQKKDIESFCLCPDFYYPWLRGSLHGFFYYTPGKLLMSRIRNLISFWFWQFLDLPQAEESSKKRNFNDQKKSILDSAHQKLSGGVLRKIRGVTL